MAVQVAVDSNFSSSEMLSFSLVTERDAAEILKLRRAAPSGALKTSPTRIEEQVEYLQRYKDRERGGSELYIRATRAGSEMVIGYFRLTELRTKGVFNWASLVTARESSISERLDVILCSYALGFALPEKAFCGPFPVRRSNVRVVELHRAMGIAKVIEGYSGPDEECVYFGVDRLDFLGQLPGWQRRGLGTLSRGGRIGSV